MKGNQSKLSAQATAALDKAARSPRTAIHETEETAHGRHEVRRCFINPFKQTPGENALVDLKFVARVEAWRTIDGKSTHKVKNYALSKRLTLDALMEIARQHWLVENKLHWQLDVLMAEDETRSRKNNAPANLGILRRLALNTYRADPRKIPMSHKRLDAGWSPLSFLTLLTHMR
ncbi:MAG: ISAs1 family transposase [Caulobacteraceae bacterium]